MVRTMFTCTSCTFTFTICTITFTGCTFTMNGCVPVLERSDKEVDPDKNSDPGFLERMKIVILQVSTCGRCKYNRIQFLNFYNFFQQYSFPVRMRIFLAVQALFWLFYAEQNYKERYLCIECMLPSCTCVNTTLNVEILSSKSIQLHSLSLWVLFIHTIPPHPLQVIHRQLVVVA